MRTQNLQQLGTQPPVGGAAETVGGARRNGSEQAEATGQMSVIGADITVTGNIEASIDLHIEGRVIGDVRCATLILAEGSYVNGRIFAARAKISGTVQGGLQAKDLAVEATGRLTGDVTYQRIRIANGGVIEGKVKQKDIA